LEIKIGDNYLTKKCMIREHFTALSVRFSSTVLLIWK
jgi:hypothetical protein